jgi:PTS system galactitol-specific IIC component
MVLIGTVLLTVGFYVANGLAPAITQVAGEAGFAIPEDAVMISSIADGFVWPPLVMMWLADVLQWIGVAIFAVFVAVLFFLFKKNETAWEVAVGASPKE